jgi:hypothetical protein
MFLHKSLAVLGLTLPLLAAAAPLESSYTELAASRCKTLEAADGHGVSVQQCSGTAGYSLLVEDFDGRQTVTVVAPDGRRHALEYARVITTGFSSLGAKAEWRTERRGGKAVPVALIIRVNANEDGGAPGKRVSYLAVAKITPERICVTDKVSGGAQGNEKARLAADGAAGKPCL